MTNIEILLANNVGTVIILWAITYALDYYLTILGARIYAAEGKQHFVFEGSYEITPEFHEDVKALRMFSPLLLRYLLSSIGIILIVWLVAVRLLRYEEVFSALIGGLFLREAAIYLMHIRSIALFIIAHGEKGARGRVHYPRWVTLRVSGIEFAGFSLLYLLLFFLDKSWFFFGGAAACSITAIQHLSLSNQVMNVKPTFDPSAAIENDSFTPDQE